MDETSWKKAFYVQCAKTAILRRKYLVLKRVYVDYVQRVQDQHQRPISQTMYDESCRQITKKRCRGNTW